MRTALWQGARPRTSSKRSWTRTPRTTPRKALAKRGGRAARFLSSEASKTAVGHKQAKGWTRNSERNSERAGHSQTELFVSLLFNELGVPLARLLPPPARGYPVRWPGEEVDLRNTFLFSLAARRPPFFSIPGFPALQTVGGGKHGKLEPRPGSVLYKAHVPQKICAVCQATGAHVASGSIALTVMGLDVYYNMNWNQRAYICRRHQHGFEIAE